MTSPSSGTRVAKDRIDDAFDPKHEAMLSDWR